MMRFSACIAVFAMTAAAWAGGPFFRLSNNQPVGHDSTQNLTYNLDPGNLTTFLTNEMMRQIVADQFAKWTAIQGNTLTISEADDVANDIDSAADLNAAISAGLSPVVFDEDGTIFSELGAGSNTLAFAGPWTTVSGANGVVYSQFRAVFGGPAMTGFPDGRVQAVVLHEFGHALGLGHAVCNAPYFGGREYREYGAPPNEDREVMFWQSTSATPALARDDISGFLSLYGSTATGDASLGAISGTIYFPDGATPADGVNVTVRDLSGDGSNVFSNAASTISEPGTGNYRIVGLPPGQYAVEVRDIAEDTLNSGAYSDPIRTDNPMQNNSGSSLLGAFPGPPEYYNGANESGSSSVDNVDEFTLVEVTAGNEVSGIDILFNTTKSGSLLGNLYYAPEVAASPSEDTLLGIVNRSGNTAQIEIFGFGSDGSEIGQSALLTGLDPLAKAWIDVKAAFPDDFANVAWIQVGSSEALHVFVELRRPGSLSAYWASNQLYNDAFMPHVAKNTALFQTVLSTINGDEPAISTDLVAQPGGDTANVPEHGTGYAKSEQDLRDIFGDDLSAVDWVQIQSDGAGSASMEYFVGLPETTRVASLGLDNRSGDTLRFLHVAADTSNFWTGLVYMNVGDQQADFTETYYDTDGQVISTMTKTLDAGAKINPIPLFDENNTEPAGTAWVEVSSTQPIVGYELFGSPISSNNDYFVGLQGVYNGGAVIDYPHIHRGDSAFTALVALNLGDEAADITFTAYDEGGNALESSEQTGIAAKRKLALLTSNLFSADTLANVAWIRATTSASTWAGFQLWGDAREERLFLAGINGAASGENTNTVDGLFIVNEQENNNTYQNAQVLTRQGDEWAVNVIGQIDLNEADTPVTVPGDDIEDIYAITLDEPTKLLIAIAPDDANADLDLYVTQGQFPISLNQFDSQRSDATLDWSFGVIGDESVARVFPAGTYYIHVSSFDGSNPVSAVEYGLLIASQPLVLETFDDIADLSSWTLGTLNADTDGMSNWEVIEGFAGHKYGPHLTGPPPTTGGATEAPAAVPPNFTLPETGLTLFDVDTAVLVDGSAGETINQVGFGLIESPPPPAASLVTLNPATATSNVTYDGTTLTSAGWLTWIATIGQRQAGAFVATPGSSGASVILGANYNVGRIVFDNLRVFKLFTSNALSKSKRSGEVRNLTVAPERRDGLKKLPQISGKLLLDKK